MPLTWPTVTLILGVLAFVAFLLWWADRATAPRKGCASKYLPCSFEGPHAKQTQWRGYAAPTKRPHHVDDQA